MWAMIEKLRIRAWFMGQPIVATDRRPLGSSRGCVAPAQQAQGLELAHAERSAREQVDGRAANERDAERKDLGADMPPERVVEAYGMDKLERLVALKDRWDPDNVFHLNANITPTGV